MKLTDAQSVEIGLTPDPGIYLNVPARDYFRWPYLSKSALTKFCISPAQHRAVVDGIIQWGRTEALLLGSAVDVLWFDGLEAFKEAFAREPLKPPLKKDGTPYVDWINSSPGKKWAKQQEAQGKKVLTKTLWKKAAAMVRRLDAHQGKDGHPSASEIKISSTLQVSLVWICPITGLWLKGRPDMVNFDQLILSDLKTAQDVRWWAFQKAVSNYDYHWQLYFYRQALAIHTDTRPEEWLTKFVTVRNEPVHSVEIHNLQAQALEQASREVTEKLWEYRDCARDKNWPADSGIEHQIDLPSYRRRA